jgi:predicted transcriptional regulator
MKTNVTLKLDDKLLRQVRILAAQQNSSISQILTEQLQKVLDDRKAYERAKKRAFELMDEGFAWNFKPPRSRDELYER